MTRDELIEKAKQSISNFGARHITAEDMADFHLDMLEKQWVYGTVNEPTESGEYIVTAEYQGRRLTGEAMWLGYWDAPFQFDRIIAWQPLPAPAKI